MLTPVAIRRQDEPRFDSHRTERATLSRLLEYGLALPVSHSAERTSQRRLAERVGTWQNKSVSAPAR